MDSSLKYRGGEEIRRHPLADLPPKNGHLYNSREVFNEEAVRLALGGGMSRSRIARDLGININSLASWIKAAKVTHEGEMRNET
jgi:hypothetical protein